MTRSIANRPGQASGFGADTSLLRLDFNEGARPGENLFSALSDAELMRTYPDRSDLENLLAERFGLVEQRVVVTAGADDALDRICRVLVSPDKKLLCTTPGFSTLERLGAEAGGQTLGVPWPAGERFPISELISDLQDGVGVVVVISPNNPTGATVSKDELIELSEAAAERAAVVVLDQVYAEYADDEAAGVTEIALSLDNVVIVRTFSKAWGLAGCRVGYLLAPLGLASRLRERGNPYPVAGPSLRLAEQRLLKGGPELAEHVEAVRRERRELLDLLLGLGVRASESQASFLLVELGDKANFVARGLEAQGIRVRSFRRPELEGRVRITLPGDRNDFDRLCRALENCLSPEALLFDLDGVLADVSESYDRAIVLTAREMGVEIGRPEIVRERELGDANNDWDLTRRLLARFGIEISREEVRERFQRLYLGEPGRPGLRDLESALIDSSLLEDLAGRWPLAVVTGRPKEEAEYFLESMGWSRLFRTVISMEDAPAKPDPAPVRLALERLEVRRAFFFGDTPDDMRAGIGAGVLPIGVIAPGGVDAETLQSCGAVKVLPSVKRIEEVLPCRDA